MSHKISATDNCIKNGCRYAVDCERCGFDRAENERRKKIPLTLCKDGLMRKIIPRKNHETPEVQNVAG